MKTNYPESTGVEYFSEYHLDEMNERISFYLVNRGAHIISLFITEEGQQFKAILAWCKF